MKFKHYINIRQLVGYVIVVVGCFLIVYGFSSKHHLASAKAEIHQMATSKNPIVQSVGKDMEKKVGQYGIRPVLCFFGGTLLVLAGAYVVFVCRKK